LSLDEWDSFLQLTKDKGLRSICLEGLEHARSCFNTRYSDVTLATLARPGAIEPAARYLCSSKLRQQWMDIAALNNASKRMQYLRELAFPSAKYMRNKYPRHQRTWLPWLYFRRALEGLAKRASSGHAEI
jgi:hypothetical protein